MVQPLRAMVRPLANGVKDHVAGPQLDPAPYRRCFGLQRKLSKNPSRKQRHEGDALHVFAAANCLKMAKLQPSQSRFEIPATSDDEANDRTAYAGLVFVRVAKRGRATLRHALHLAPRRQTLAIAAVGREKK